MNGHLKLLHLPSDCVNMEVRFWFRPKADLLQVNTASNDGHGTYLFSGYFKCME